MSCFLLSSATCKKITVSISNFGWSNSVDKRGFHWRRWTEMTQPKCNGGMCFRDLRLFNIAMLGKQGCRLMTWKIFFTWRFSFSKKKKHASHTWRAILAGRKALNLGLIKRIGDGTQTNVWTDNWIPEGIGFKPIYRKETATADRVNELINHVNMTWDQEALESNFIEADVQAVKRVPLGWSAADVWAWSGEKHGLYTVKSAYHVLADLETHQRWFKEGGGCELFCSLEQSNLEEVVENESPTKSKNFLVVCDS
jgi:hypothetical protein